MEQKSVETGKHNLDRRHPFSFVLSSSFISFVIYLLSGILIIYIAFHFQETKDQNKQQLQQVKQIDQLQPQQTSMTRSVLKSFLAIEQSEGVGAKVRRSIGTGQMRNFLPFLMLDHFNVQPPAGFPDHPHHGQETITYITEGMMAHEDFTGSKGVLRPGDLQFMTAGKGIVHSEIPVDSGDGKSAIGLQLWVDLPENLKNCEPRYRDLRKEEIPEANPSDFLKIKVISGKSYGVESLQDLAYTPVHFYHFQTSKKGTVFEQYMPTDFNSFIYILKGSITINDKLYPQYSSIFFNTDSDIVKGASASEITEFAIIGGQILDQPVVQYGPFVETSKSKILEVIQNYQQGKNGFEKAPHWRSSISDGIEKKRANEFLEKDGLLE